MATLTRRESNNTLRDPFALARELFNWDPFQASRTVATFAPSFEVKETPDAYVVKADLPGVKDEDLDISLHNGVLSVSGARKTQERKEGETYFVYERQYGQFSRSFALPETADPDKVEAKLDAGVLSLTIAKKVQAKPRRIELKR
jgi:HSP20 family protein